MYMYTDTHANKSLCSFVENVFPPASITLWCPTKLLLWVSVHLGRKSPRLQGMLGPISWNTALHERTWESWLPSTWTQATCSGVKEGVCHSRLYEECCQKLEGADPSPLLSTSEVTPGFLSPVLSFPVQRRRQNAGKNLWRAMKMIKGLKHLTEGKAARAVAVQPGEGKA